jgi:hypothetical protein
MTTIHRTVLAAAMLALATGARAESPDAIENPAIDMPGYLRAASAAALYRDHHRVTEQEFARLAHLPDTVILDARSRDKYDVLHVAGAINLSFPDIAVATLRQRIPDRSTRILIYCNNNFVAAPDPFPTKLPAASLNLSTYIALYTYGYRNVWELGGPPIDPVRSRLVFAGTAAP